MKGATMHVKSDSEVTSIDASSPPRSPRRQLYYVQSPSQHDVEKMSYGSSPFASPVHHHYHCSPIHHSRESSTTRFSASLKNTTTRYHPGGWKRLQRRGNLGQPGVNDDEGDEDDDDDDDSGNNTIRFYLIVFVLSFLLLFSIFSLILFGASLSYKPKIIVKGMVFWNFFVQAGMDPSGVPTDMLTTNSTVRIFFRNPSTFFGVHVSSTPMELHYFQLKVATGYVKKFYQTRQSEHVMVTIISGNQVPLYGGIPLLNGAKDHLDSISVPLNLTFKLRSRAYILGRLVKTKFYRNVLCQVTLKGNKVGKHQNLTKSCIYHE
ncbi:uncharacterized protein LOC124932381 [Impatiens glandulifera]|uniref:uncharacterized protein LOC124932381 n=1 Tax=Impatiens glandulifera TaxID=253017 RepID=UPI001FB09EF7|nr:uncharacterized protein LOC124932381 [Impatiens glandulifera]